MKNKKGFTLVELLVVIAIIGLLSTLAVIALGSARSKARDARRISDIKQTQTALELYYADAGEYPNPYTASVLGDAAGGTSVLCDAGFTDGTGCSTEYMGQVPSNDLIPSAWMTDYTYTSDGITYTITFQLEGDTGGLTGGSAATLEATPSGLTSL